MRVWRLIKWKYVCAVRTLVMTGRNVGDLYGKSGGQKGNRGEGRKARMRGKEERIGKRKGKKRKKNEGMEIKENEREEKDKKERERKREAFLEERLKREHTK